MEIRKSYFTVKIPTSIPETEECKPIEPILIKKYQKKEVNDIISLSYKLSAMVPRNWMPFFPCESRFKSFSALKKQRMPTRESLTPLKLRKYVESVLDKKGFDTDKKHQRNYSSFIMAKECSNRPERKNFIRQRLIPITKL